MIILEDSGAVRGFSIFLAGINGRRRRRAPALTRPPVARVG